MVVATRVGVDVVTMLIPSLIIAFTLGICVGSFLNVVVYRLPRGESLVWPGSRCPRCTAPLSACDNIPVLSFFLLRARCRECGIPISARYPLVELAGGLLFVACALRWGMGHTFVLWALTLSAFLAVALIDLDTFIIPDSLCIIAAFGGAVLAVLTLRGEVLWSRILSAMMGAGFVWALNVLSRGGMGFGDVKLVAAMGITLGGRGLVVAFSVAVLSGATAGILLLLLRRKRRGDPVPFGPFLVLGVLVAALMSEPLLEWYARFAFR